MVHPLYKLGVIDIFRSIYNLVQCVVDFAASSVENHQKHTLNIMNIILHNELLASLSSCQLKFDSNNSVIKSPKKNVKRCN